MEERVKYEIKIYVLYSCKHYITPRLRNFDFMLNYVNPFLRKIIHILHTIMGILTQNTLMK